MKDLEINIEETWRTVKIKESYTRRLSKEKISALLGKKPGGIYRSVSSLAGMYFYLKLVFILGLTGLVSLLGKNTGSLVIILTLLVISVILSISDIMLQKRIRSLRYDGKSLIDNLQDLMQFLNTDFHIYITYASLINPLLILTGAFYYDYFKYGDAHFIRESSSLIVFGFLVILGYILGFIVNKFSLNQMKKEIGVYIEQLEADQLSEEKMQKLRSAKLRRLILMVFILLAGIALFTILYFRA